MRNVTNEDKAHLICQCHENSKKLITRLKLQRWMGVLSDDFEANEDELSSNDEDNDDDLNQFKEREQSNYDNHNHHIFQQKEQEDDEDEDEDEDDNQPRTIHENDDNESVTTLHSLNQKFNSFEFNNSKNKQQRNRNSNNNSNKNASTTIHSDNNNSGVYLRFDSQSMNQTSKTINNNPSKNTQMYQSQPENVQWRQFDLTNDAKFKDGMTAINVNNWDCFSDKSSYNRIIISHIWLEHLKQAIAIQKKIDIRLIRSNEWLSYIRVSARRAIKGGAYTHLVTTSRIKTACALGENCRQCTKTQQDIDNKVSKIIPRNHGHCVYKACGEGGKSTCIWNGLHVAVAHFYEYHKHDIDLYVVHLYLLSLRLYTYIHIYL